MPVYNGGIYWQECAKSIEKYGILFDQVVVSINKGGSYKSDIIVAENIKLDNLKILIQVDLLAAVDHFCKIFQQVRTKYVFILAHDDLLLGSVKSLKLKLDELGCPDDVAFLGTFLFSKNNEDVALVKEVYNGVMDKTEFVEYDLAKHFNLNISGMCLPVKTIEDNLDYLSRFVSGIRFDYLLLTNDKINTIFQLDEPTVRISMHDNQQGKIIGNKGRVADSILYFLYHIANSNDLILKEKLINEFVGNLAQGIKCCPIFTFIFYFKNFIYFGKKMGVRGFLNFNITIISLVSKKLARKALRGIR